MVIKRIDPRIGLLIKSLSEAVLSRGASILGLHMVIIKGDIIS